MLHFSRLSFTYPGAMRPALAGLDLELAAGEYLVLLGANGSGKSTLARLANGLLLPSAGHVRLDNLDSADEASLMELRRRVGLLMQDPDDQIVATTVQADVAFGPENLGLPAVEIQARVRAALAAVGLAGLAAHDPNTLSGGQAQRLAIAGVLAMQPDYLVLDEPGSMLDSAARASLVELIQDQRAAGRGILHITHDLQLARGADRVAVLKQGELVFSGLPADLFANTQALIDWHLLATPRLSLARRRSAGVTLAEPVGAVSGVEFGAAPVAAPEMAAPVAAVSGVEFGAAPREALRLSLSGVSFTYPGDDAGSQSGGKTKAKSGGRSKAKAKADAAANPNAVGFLLQDISLEVRTGTSTLISGISGVGKSTLLRIMAGTLAPTAGTVAFSDGASLQPGAVGLVFQNPENQLFAATVAEDILFGPRNLGLVESIQRGTKKAEAALVDAALAAVGLDAGYAQRSPFALSGGEMRRLAIAGIVAMRRPFLLFDEPTAGLDAQGRAFIQELMAGLLDQGVGIVIVSHDIAEFANQVDRHLRLEGGRLWPS